MTQMTRILNCNTKVEWFNRRQLVDMVCQELADVVDTSREGSGFFGPEQVPVLFHRSTTAS